MTKLLPTRKIPDKLGHEFADADLVQTLRRPPWHVASTREISDATGITFGRLSNWLMRRLFVPPETRQLYHRVGNKSLFRIDRVVEWLSGVPLEEQAQRYLGSVGLAADDRELWPHVVMLERLNVWPHVWRPRDFEMYLASLAT